jgi:hypothetical protein
MQPEHNKKKLIVGLYQAADCYGRGTVLPVIGA